MLCSVAPSAIMNLLFLLPLVSPRSCARDPIAVTDDGLVHRRHHWCRGAPRGPVRRLGVGGRELRRCTRNQLVLCSSRSSICMSTPRTSMSSSSSHLWCQLAARVRRYCLGIGAAGLGAWSRGWRKQEFEEAEEEKKKEEAQAIQEGGYCETGPPTKKRGGELTPPTRGAGRRCSPCRARG